MDKAEVVSSSAGKAVSETAKPAKQGKLKQLLASARFEALLAVLLILTAAAIISKDTVLLRTLHFMPQNVVDLPRFPISDGVESGNSGVVEHGPLNWTCQLRPGAAYPFCAYELFFTEDQGANGLNLTNMHSFTIRMRYDGPATSFRIHLKNYDPRYSVSTTDDSSKFLRVEADTTPGVLQEVTFKAADFGVADWWLRKFRHSPELGHPQFDNIISMNIETGSEAPMGQHAFRVQDIEIRYSLLSDAQWYSLLLGGWILMIVGYLIYRISNLKRTMAQRHALEQMALEEAREAARRDPLTQLLNRRGLYENYGQNLEKRGSDIAVTTILIDLDFFKRLNDTFGHDAGDKIIATVGTVISANVRSADLVSRWGGEEFLVVCMGIDRTGADVLADKIRKQIANHNFGPYGQITASVGVHWAQPPEADLKDMITKADLALYAAKRGGRNRARMHQAGMSKAA